MQLLQTYVENSEQTWRAQASASTSWFEKKLFLDGVPLEKSRPARPTPLTAQGFSRRFRRESRQFVVRRSLSIAARPLVLDGLTFDFEGRSGSCM